MGRCAAGWIGTPHPRCSTAEHRKVVTCLPVPAGSAGSLFTVDMISALRCPTRRHTRVARSFATSAPPSYSMVSVSPGLILIVVQALTMAQSASKAAECIIAGYLRFRPTPNLRHCLAKRFDSVFECRAGKQDSSARSILLTGHLLFAGFPSGRLNRIRGPFAERIGNGFRPVWGTGIPLRINNGTMQCPGTRPPPSGPAYHELFLLQPRYRVHSSYSFAGPNHATRVLSDTDITCFATPNSFLLRGALKTANIHASLGTWS